MFVRLKKHIALALKFAESNARCAIYKTEMMKREAEAIASRKEIRRLTDVIIHLKEKGQELPPGHGDRVWGKHIMDEGSAPEPSTYPVFEGPTPEDREAAIGEAEFHDDLRAALAAEDGH